MTGAQFLARALDAYGVTHVFFVPTILAWTLAELERSTGISRVMAHDERAAGYMADGYARASGRPGVAWAQMIGTSNLAAGLRDAYMARSPVVALTGGSYPESRHRNQYQEVPNAPIFDPVTKFNAHAADLTRLPDLFQQAFREATTGKPGPVHLSVEGHLGETLETQEADLEVIVDDRFTSTPAFRPGPDPASVREALRLLLAAERPVLVAGGGVRASGAGAELVELAEKLSIPIATSLNAKDVLPADHPLSLGVVGLYARQSANWAVLESDLVCFIGSQTGSQVTNEWRVPAMGTPIIHIDIAPEELGRHYATAVSILSDAKVALRQLSDAAAANGGGRNEWLERARALGRAWSEHVAPQVKSDASPMRPERLCTELGRLLPSDALVVCDTGHAGMWLSAYLDLTQPEQGFIRAGGTLGWSFPASLGAKLAVGSRPVFVFLGDGGLWYHLAELETAVRWGINVVIVLNNNRSLNEEVVVYEPAYGGKLHGRHAELWKFEDVDFPAIARAIGANALSVNRQSELEPAIEHALEMEQVTLIDVRTDIDALAEEASLAVPEYAR